MREIGLNDSQIGIAMGIMLFVTVAFEVPSGILSDRWSRKGTLNLGYGSLLICGVLTYFSNGFISYTIATCFWGIYWAMMSGLRESIIYDVILEEQQDIELFEKTLGRFYIFSGSGLVAGALGSSVVVYFFEPRIAFALSIIPTVFALITTSQFVESKVQQQNQESQLIAHIKQTFREVLRQPNLYLLVMVIVLTGVGARIIYEFMQIWWLGLGVSLVFFGPISACIYLSEFISGFLADKFKYNKVTYLLGFTSLISLCLIVQNIYIVVFAQLSILTTALIAGIILAKKLNDQISSEVRSGAGSVVSFITNIIAIPTLIIFGYVSEKSSISNAAWIVVLILALTLIGMFKLNKSSLSVT